MTYLLDSDVVIYYIDGLPQAVTKERELLPTGVAMSAISLMEFSAALMGVRNRSSRGNGLSGSLARFLCIRSTKQRPDAVPK